MPMALRMRFDTLSFAPLVDYFVKRLAAEQRWKMGATLDYLTVQTNYCIDAVQAIRQGRFIPQAETIHKLVEIGHRTGLEQEWAQALMVQSGRFSFAEIETYLGKLWHATSSTAMSLPMIFEAPPVMNLQLYAFPTESDVQVLRIGGYFDSGAAPTIMQWLEREGKRPNANVVFNFEQVEKSNFHDVGVIDSLLYGVFVLRQNGGDLRLCHLSQQMQSDFEVSGLNLAIEIFDNEKTAVLSFGP